VLFVTWAAQRGATGGDAVRTSETASSMTLRRSAGSAIFRSARISIRLSMIWGSAV
jgi:hypothetical protein